MTNAPIDPRRVALNYPSSSSVTPHTLVMRHTSISNLGLRSARWSSKPVPTFSSNYQMAADLLCIDHSFTKDLRSEAYTMNRATSSASLNRRNSETDKENKIKHNNFVSPDEVKLYNPAETHMRHGRNRPEYNTTTNRIMSAKYATRQDSAPSGARQSHTATHRDLKKAVPKEHSLGRIVSEPRIIEAEDLTS